MKKTLLSTLAVFVLSLPSVLAQVGIGTTTPQAYFNVPQGRTVLFGNDTNQVDDNNSNRVSKLIWYGSKGAFRAGTVYSSVYKSVWDFDNVGLYSFATGGSTLASVSYSTAMGFFTTASGFVATAMGSGSQASAEAATAMGYLTTASALAAVSMGNSTTANGAASTAMGNQTRASGGSTTSTGYKTIASGDYSTAMGANVSTNGKPGSFIIGDKNSDANVYNNSANNQMMMRFGGGYVLYTTNGAFSAGTALGVQLASGGNAWQTVSDSTRKENFRKANGADFLQKIARMRLGSWNYKGQDAKTYRHYGPMAQDFFAAFGRDELGVIGEDKSINQADFDGVNLIAIQALIKKVEKLEAENNSLRQENAALNSETQARLDKIEARLQQQATTKAVTFKP